MVISSLCLHQLPDANALWETVKHVGKPGASFAVFDLIRVDDDASAWCVVNSFTPYGQEVFKQDFKNSLRAAYTAEEVNSQLAAAGLTGSIKVFEVHPGCSVFCVIGQLG